MHFIILYWMRNEVKRFPRPFQLKCDLWTISQKKIYIFSFIKMPINTFERMNCEHISFIKWIQFYFSENIIQINSFKVECLSTAWPTRSKKKSGALLQSYITITVPTMWDLGYVTECIDGRFVSFFRSIEALLIVLVNLTFINSNNGEN